MAAVPILAITLLGLLSTSASAGTRCPLAGYWTGSSEFATTTWDIKEGGKASESGGGNAEGIAVLEGDTLTITWQTKDEYAGVYSWELSPDCSGAGDLIFTTVATGDSRPTNKKYASTVKGPAPLTADADLPPPPAGPPQIRNVSIESRGFSPATLAARAGDVLRICNGKRTRDRLFSYSKHNRFGAQNPDDKKNRFQLKPGECRDLTIHNPGSSPIKFDINSEIRSRAKVSIMVHPS